MIAFTTKVTHLKADDTTNEFGDEIDGYNAVSFGVPAHIYEKGTTSLDGTSGRYTTVRTPKALVPYTFAVSKGDRLTDETTGFIYTVVDVTTYTNIVMQRPKELSLKIIDSSTSL